MALQCNIDRRGRVVRLGSGMVVLVMGVVLVFWWAVPTGEVVAWVGAGTCVFAGGFMIFEGRAGWCVVRAMGWRTWV